MPSPRRTRRRPWPHGRNRWPLWSGIGGLFRAGMGGRFQRNTQGALFETYVVSELVKQRFNAGQPADLYFWRDHTGHEVDVLYETPQGLQAIEIKSGSTFAADWLEGVHKWRQVVGEVTLPPLVIFGGEGSYERESCRVRGWRLLETHNLDPVD